MPNPQSRSVCTKVLILGSACSLTKWSEPPGKGTSGRWTTSGRCSEEEDSAPWTTCRLSAQSVTERSVPLRSSHSVPGLSGIVHAGVGEAWGSSVLGWDPRHILFLSSPNTVFPLEASVSVTDGRQAACLLIHPRTRKFPHHLAEKKHNVVCWS